MDVFEIGFNKDLQKPYETTGTKDAGYDGGKFGDFIRIEGGSLIIKDSFGIDRVIIGEI
jgi:hypothetical protein